MELELDEVLGGSEVLPVLLPLVEEPASTHTFAMHSRPGSQTPPPVQAQLRLPIGQPPVLEPVSVCAELVSLSVVVAGGSGQAASKTSAARGRILRGRDRSARMARSIMAERQLSNKPHEDRPD